MGVPTKRQARRDRNREDFVRATTQRLEEVGQHKHAVSGVVGANAGPTYQEHLEDQLALMVDKFKAAQARGDEDKARTARGIIRGLAMALALHENSYDFTTQHIVKIEKGFMS